LLLSQAAQRTLAALLRASKATKIDLLPLGLAFFCGANCVAQMGDGLRT
jgi:hypothetical protein